MFRNFVRVIVLFAAMGLSNSFAQSPLILGDTELIQKEDLKKKAGWLKLKVDSNFAAVSNDAAAKYEYYAFADKKGFWQFQFPDKDCFVTYKKSDPTQQTKLLNGVVCFYNQKQCLLYRYIFKNGFYTYVYDYTKGAISSDRNGKKLISLFQYIPHKTSFEYIINTFDNQGVYSLGAHIDNDGYKTTRLPIPDKAIAAPVFE